jgi:hypothetical protein
VVEGLFHACFGKGHTGVPDLRAHDELVLIGAQAKIRNQDDANDAKRGHGDQERVRLVSGMVSG